MTSRNKGQNRARIHTMLGVAASAAASLLVAGTWSGSARAADYFDSTSQAKVNYSDLDLRTETGSHALHQRIVAAAARVCPWEYSHELRVITATQQCRAAAVAAAMNEVHNQQVALSRGTRSPEG